MRKVVIASNFLNEVDQVEAWVENFRPIADGGMLVVDGGSTDGTIELLEKLGVKVIVSNIIQKEGYGPARNNLRFLATNHFDAEWVAYFDADERINPSEYHRFRFIKDYLIAEYDVIAFPRIDWYDLEKTKAAKDWHVDPDWQARMTLLKSPLNYIRRLHEQLEGFNKMYANLRTPAINHFHRTVPQDKRDYVGKVCAHLHSIDEMGKTYPEHHKEAYYRDLLAKEGL
jgi:glycosyltransferase involved in cell wall biosynthesis